MRYVVSTNRGLFVISMKKVGSGGLFGGKASYPFRCARYLQGQEITQLCMITESLYAVCTPTSLLTFDILDNQVMCRVPLVNVHSISVIEDTLNIDAIKYLVIALGSSVRICKHIDLVLKDVYSGKTEEWKGTIGAAVKAADRV